MYFLSIESSTKNFALAVSHDDKVLRFRNLAANKVLEDAIIKDIDKLLSLARLKFEQIDAFAIGLGPGSFTSLRVGLSTVKAFAMASKKPMVGICSLDIIAQGAAGLDADEICVVVDARRQLVYSALYQKTAKGLKQKGKYQLSSMDAVLEQVKGKTLFVGDALGIYRAQIETAYKKCDSGCTAVFAPEKYWLPQAQTLASLSYKRLLEADYDDVGRLLPVYLYPSDCQVSK